MFIRSGACLLVALYAFIAGRSTMSKFADASRCAQGAGTSLPWYAMQHFPGHWETATVEGVGGAGPASLLVKWDGDDVMRPSRWPRASSLPLMVGAAAQLPPLTEPPVAVPPLVQMVRLPPAPAGGRGRGRGGRGRGEKEVGAGA